MTNASQLTGPVISAAQGIFSESSAAMHTVGSYIETNDGRGFRYAKAGAVGFVVGRLYQSAAEDTTNQESLTCAVNSIGDTAVVTTTTVTLAANLLAGGFMTVISGTLGVGYTYKIKSNTAAAGAVVTFTLADPIQVATTGTVIVDVSPNPYSGVIITPAGTATSAAVGVSVYNGTALYYGWVQTHGPASVLCSTTITVGNSVTPINATTAGAATVATNGVKAPIGYALTGIATTDCGLVFLTIN